MTHPQETKDKAIALYQSGLSLAESGKEVGVAAFTVQDWLKQSGIDRRPTHEDIENLKKEAIVLYQQGDSINLVAEKVGRSHVTVLRWLKQAKIPRRKNNDRTLALIVHVSPELEAIPSEDRRRFCLEAIAKALKEKTELGF